MRYPLDYPPGVIADDTVLSSGGRYIDADKIRFPRGKGQLIGGWERLVRQAVGGVCRTAFAWKDNLGRLNIALGTHTGLYVWRGGVLANITPYKATPRIGSDPFTVTNGSGVVSVLHAGHGLTSGDAITISGATAVGRLAINGSFTATVLDADHYTFNFGSNAAVSRTLAASPLSVVSGSPVVTVTETAHGIADGTQVTFAGAAAVGGITPNGTFPITVVNANSYKFTFTANASSTATGGGSSLTATVPTTGGGSDVLVVPQVLLPAGQLHGTGTAGYGTGSYGVGPYSQPSVEDYFPRTWSFGMLGQALVASPRGGAAYIWENDTSVRARQIKRAPTQITAIMTTPERYLLALGCNEEAAPYTFNPRCVRHCDPRPALDDGRLGFEVWDTDTSTLSREKILEGAGRIVAGRGAGPASFVWTDNELFMAEYTGDTVGDLYRFTMLGEDCGLLGPNAGAVRNQRAFWLTPDLQVMTAGLGGEPAAIECPMQDELRANLSPSQRDKVVASTISGFGEVWFFYPDRRDGLENSRALFFHTQDGWWSKAKLARTAFVDAGPADYPVGVAATGEVYWHERGNSADGERISWSLKAGPQFIDSGGSAVFMRSFWPDFQGQVGTMNLTLLSREKPQAADRVSGPFALAPGAEEVDLRVDGVLLGWLLEGNSGPAAFRMGTPIVEGKTTRRTK